MADPEQHYVAQRIPQPRQGIAIEMDVDDVLVFLGGVLGELDGAVGAPVEPFGMLLDPRMIGRTLNREIQRDLQPVVAGRIDQAAEIVEIAQLGVDRVMPTIGGPDGVRAAGIVRASGQAVVRTLAVRAPDRVYRREIQHVKPQIAHIGQTGDHVVERAVPVHAARLRPGHQLVPRTEGCGLPVDMHGQWVRLRQVRAGRRADHQRGDLIVRQRRQAGSIALLRQGVVLRQDRLQRGLVLRGRAALRASGGLDQLPSFGQFQRYRLARRVLGQDLLAPGREQVAPCGKGNLIIARLVERLGSLPTVIDQKGHGHLGKDVLSDRTRQQSRRDDVMSIREDVRLEDVRLSCDDLCGKSPSVHLMRDPLDRKSGGGQGEKMAFGIVFVGHRLIIGISM